MNDLSTCYRRMGAFLMILGISTGVLFILRFGPMRSVGSIDFLDDFLTMGLSNIFLFPSGIWLHHLGSHGNNRRMTRCPLVLIAITPAAILILSASFLLHDFANISFAFIVWGESRSLAAYSAIAVVCAISFISGNLLLLFQLRRNRITTQAERNARPRIS